MARKPRSLLGSFVMATTLAIGFGTFWFVLVNVVGDGIFDGLAGSPTWPPRENLAVRADGTPLIASTPRGVVSAEYRELTGRAVREREGLRLLDPFYLDTLSRGSELGNVLLLSGWENRQRRSLRRIRPVENL